MINSNNLNVNDFKQFKLKQLILNDEFNHFKLKQFNVNDDFKQFKS